MMREINPVTRSKAKIRHRSVLALDLQVRIPKLDLCHVLSRGHLDPTGFRHRFPDIDRYSATRAAQQSAVADSVAPGASICSFDRHLISIVMHVHRLNSHASRPRHSGEAHAGA